MTESNQDQRFSPLLPVSNGILLLCAMVGLTVSFLSLYCGSMAGTGPTVMDTVPVAAADTLSPLTLFAWYRGGGLPVWAALFALLALGVWSMPRFRSPVAGSLAAVWLAVVLWNRDAFLLGARLTVSAISMLFDQRVNWGLIYAFSSELPVSEQFAAVELFLILALALLALIVGWAVVCDSCWWLAMLFTLSPLLPGLLANFYPHWPAFMALCACWCTLLLTRLCRSAAPAGRGLLNLTVLPAVALVLAGLTLALPMEGYVRPAWTYAAQETLTNWGSHLSHLFEGWNGPLQGGVTYVGSAETVDLQNAGPLNYTGRTVLRVRSDYDGHLYLRGTSLAVYEDGRWTALPQDTYQEYLDQLTNGVSPTPLIFPALLNPSEQTYTVTVDNVGASGSCVYTPYQLVAQDWEDAGMLPVEDAFFAHRRSQWTQTTTFMPLADAVRPLFYPESGTVAIAGVDSAEDSIRRNAGIQERSYADYVREHYLDVPEELQALLEQFCRENDLTFYDEYIPSGAFASSVWPPSSYTPPDYWPIYCATSVGGALNKLCEYDPATPLTPEGEDFVEYFLTESHRGYCMHFASSATLILRAMGIPARYVSGFTVDTVADQQVNVPDRAAHAWVEVYIDGFGWYPVEVTPDYAWDDPAPSDIPDDPDGPSEQPTDAPEESEPPIPSDEPLPSQGPAEGPDGPGQGSGPGLGSGPASVVIRVLAALAGLAAALWLAQYLTKRLRTARQTGPDTNRAALYSYRCLLRLERWGGEVDEQALELVQKARFSQHTLTAEELQTMADKVDEQRLRLCRRLHPVQRIVFQYLWGKPKR